MKISPDRLQAKDLYLHSCIMHSHNMNMATLVRSANYLRLVVT